MDGEEELSHMCEDVSNEPNGSAYSKKREAKGTCLRIEGQDGYVFKSYSINPHEFMDAKSPACSSVTLDKDPPPSLHLCSQDSKYLESDISNHLDPGSPALSNKSPNINTGEMTDHEMYENGNMAGQHVREDIGDANEKEDETQDDDSLAFGSSIGPFVTRDGDEYSNLLSGYTSTLYDVAMDAVTQSLLSSIRSHANPRKKSPAWNHFCISPRDSTKAICLYCMKEFSRGKNEKDLSTSCLMRHVRRAHPTVLLQDGADAPLNNLTSSFSSSLIPPSPSSPKNGDLTNSFINSASKNTSPSTSSAENSDMSSKEVLPKVEPKLEPYASMDAICSMLPSSHSNESNHEDMSDGGPERLPGTPKSSSSRRRSAVWKHFYLSPADNSKAVCIHCMNEFSRGKNGKDLGTSCLIRHMWRAHKEVVIEENGQGNHIPPPYTNPPSLLSRTQLQDPPEVKKESPLLPSSPETTSDELPQNMEESMDIQEESDEVMHLSGQESSLNISFKAQGEDSPLTSSPCDISEGPGLHQDHLVFQQNKKIMKRVKSEVWHHFIVSPVDQLKALCRYCPCVISRGKRGDFGTSCLMRHLMRRHPDVLKNQKSTDEKESPPHPYTNLTATDAVSTKGTESPASETKPQTLPVFSKKTSKLWNHFSISPADPTKVVCLHCSRTISRGKKTTNLGTSCLFRHMQRFHGHVLESNNTISGDVPSADVHVKQELMETSVFETQQENERFDEDHPAAKKITKLLAEMLALDLQPSALVENAGLNRLLEYLQPQYSLPPSSYFTSTAIPDMYERVKDVVLTHLKEAEGGVVHFTTSIWVTSQTREYLTLTAHWATYESSVRPQGQDFHCSALLSVSKIDCDHDMQDIPKQLEFLWDSWITSSGLKKGFTVTDNNTIRNTLEDHGHITVQCFGHTIDLIVSEAIKSQRMVQNLLSIARKICERVHRSATAKEKLAELQGVHQLPENQLIQDVPSKWRTSFFMLERLVEQRKAIDELSIECNFREMISCDQWEVMQSVCNALKPFEVACREMSNRTATLGQVIPLIHILNRKIDLLFDETVGIDNMLKSLKEAMVSKMSATLNDPRYTWATMLDPRYKTSLFTEEEAEQCKQDLIRELDLCSSTSVEDNPPLPNGCDEAPLSSDSSKDNLWSLMDDVRQQVKHEEKPKSSDMVVLEYLEEDILDQSCDPLDYWNLKKFLWPDLAKVAARYVGCPPSIIPAETLFSTASVNCALNQPRPLLENMEGLLFLKVNLPLIYFQY
ncbi:zinc finger BED domain-containing protein 4 [Betta splendens]|uniref:Zinc finger BED domain-containing protein 4 n=1 Tax=Betta splendens TaxID=158456 RepID=A0A6P7ND62_BETSP|nr:zinc finger BED domain-containing protein 4 [Betta splendens]XP_029017582.1 zinc finger BED domain-containing protein 4 [Betta splendens]XP_029017583.1 zinc finger BED domain-containing protein 4 [Betta splendens]XP_029017584.1 zinc finger BED domain-containing protein 4 [Betta splendens]XP_029017585.1 zinc finger BED domain-containing protein 4 [Betta splendens]